MKRKLLYSVATVFLLLSFSSCEKDVDEPIPAISGQEQSVDIKNGRIAFLNDDVTYGMGWFVLGVPYGISSFNWYSNGKF